jgi:EAL domain-containing protein (putative c-di-GMP-specific phosphodiesterase class I)
VPRLRFTPRHALLLVFATATLLLMVGGALASVTLLKTSLYRSAEQAAGREARVVADLGLAAALSHGRLTRRDLRIAASEYVVARRDLALTGVVIWLPSGGAIFARGSGRAELAGSVEPPIAMAARTTGRGQVADTTNAKVGSTVEAAVPFGTRGRDAVAEFYFAPGPIQRNLIKAERRLYLLTAVGALIMYLAVLPLVARLASRIPLPVDRFRRAALAELRTALARRELVVEYQPKAETESGRVIGVEALVRWNHPQRGLLGPGGFLPIAESSLELLTGLTCQVLNCAIRDCASWLRNGCELPVAVNVAPAVLLDGSLVVLVTDALRRYELGAQMLTLEVTESALMKPDADMTVHLRQLRDLGVSVSIDDFGTGNSSLSRLRSLPLDELKVDRSFTMDIATDERALGIIRHIVHLGVELGLRVVAEGVEDERTLRLLRSIGCEVIQGFHLARPMPEEQLTLWMAGRETLRSYRAS